MEQTDLLAAAGFCSAVAALVIIPAVALHRKRERMTARTTEEDVK